MSTALITRDDAALSISFTEAAIVLKNDALEKAAMIAKVGNADEQTAAVEAQQAVAGIVSLVEKARVACKAPVLDFGRKIDAEAAKFVTEIKEEQLRLAKLVGDFVQLEQAKAVAAERARRLEEEKIEREKQEAILKSAREAAERERTLREAAERQLREEQERQRKVDEATAAARKAEQEATNAQQRKEAEARRIAIEASNEKARVEAERRRIELESAQARATAQSHAELDAISDKFSEQARSLPPANIAPARAVGQRVTDDWEITVSDIDLLARHHRNCVDITPRLSEIKLLLKGGTTPKGVNAKPIVKAGVTAGRARAAIDI